MEGATEGTGGRTEVGVVVTAAGTPETPATVPPMDTSAAAEAEAPPVVGAVVTIPGTLAAAALPAVVGRTEAAAAADCAAPAPEAPGTPPGGRPESFAEGAPPEPFFRTIARPGVGPREGWGRAVVRGVLVGCVGGSTHAPVLTSDGGESVGAGTAGKCSGVRAAGTAARTAPLPPTSTETDRKPPSCERERVPVATGRLAGAAEDAGALGARELLLSSAALANNFFSEEETMTRG